MHSSTQKTHGIQMAHVYHHSMVNWKTGQNIQGSHNQKKYPVSEQCPSTENIKKEECTNSREKNAQKL